MSLDPSLKSASSLVRHRNVLTRAERLEVLKEQEKWSDGRNSPLGLPKVAHRKQALGGGAKKEEGEGAAEATPKAGAAPAAAAAAKPAPAAAAGAKGAAAPAAGGKAAAPAAGAKKK